MNGSLPPISRLTRATRSAHDRRDPLAGRDRAGEGDAVDPLVADDPRADVAGAGDEVHDARPAGARSTGASARVESGVSSEGLQTVVLPAASAGASFQASSSSG